MFFCFLLNDINYKQLYLFFSLSGATIARIKKNYWCFIEILLSKMIKNMGGIVSCRWINCNFRIWLIRFPAPNKDDFIDTILILCVLDRNTPVSFNLNDFYIEKLKH